MSKAISLLEHIEKSKQAVAANKSKGNKHGEILSKMYVNPARYIDEILQNTEDAYSRSTTHRNGDIVFDLWQDRLDIYHNGSDFTDEDLMSITTFVQSTKQGDDGLNMIGKFGIGFKSVFAVTNSPEIHNNKSHYVIEDYEVLEECKKVKPIKGYTTLIRLPFIKENKKELYKNTERELKEYNAECLLFLKRINKIIIQKKSKTIKELFVDKEEVDEKLSLKRIVGDKEKTYLCIHGIDNLSIAFETVLKNNERSIIASNNNKLFVFFPTEQQTHIPFIINAPFTTSPTREQIPFDKKRAPENLILLDKLAKLLIRSFKRLKLHGYFNESFISMIIFSKKEDSIMCSVFKEYIYNSFKNKPNIPTLNGFQKAEDCLITKDFDLHNVLTRKDILHIYNKTNWVTPSINEQENNDIYRYYIDILGIKETNITGFGFQVAVRPDFLPKKSHQWMIKFYGLLKDNPKLWDKYHAKEIYSLRYKPIMLINNGELAAPYYEDETPRVFLPAGGRLDVDCLKNNLLDKEDVREFVEALELPSRLPIRIFDELLDKYNTKTKATKKQWVEDMSLLALNLKGIDSIWYNRIIKKIQQTSLVYTHTITPKKFKFYNKPSQCYWPGTYFNKAFEGCDMHVVDLVLLKDNGFNDQMLSDLRSIFLDASMPLFPEYISQDYSKDLKFENAIALADYVNENIESLSDYPLFLSILQSLAFILDKNRDLIKIKDISQVEMDCYSDYDFDLKAFINKIKPVKLESIRERELIEWFNSTNFEISDLEHVSLQSKWKKTIEPEMVEVKKTKLDNTAIDITSKIDLENGMQLLSVLKEDTSRGDMDNWAYKYLEHYFVEKNISYKSLIKGEYILENGHKHSIVLSKRISDNAYSIPYNIIKAVLIGLSNYSVYLVDNVGSSSACIYYIDDLKEYL